MPIVQKALFSLFLLAALLTTAAAAQTIKERKHERALLLRLHIGSGIGGLKNRPLYDDKELEFESGIPLLLNFQLGATIRENLAIHGGISNLNAQSYWLFVLAGGVSYYAMPFNFYISPEYRFLGWATGYNDNRKFYYNRGRGIGVTIGKEWWVAANWGLGLALSFYWDRFEGYVKESTSSYINKSYKNGDRAESRYLGIAASITYN